MDLVSLAIAIAFALVHLFGGKLRSLTAVPHSAWLSAAGGVSVAYVFLHLLPAIAEHRETLADHWLLSNLDSPHFLVALVGLVVFYGLERAARRHRPARTADREIDDAEFHDWVFWLHVASFSIYNVIIGYLLVRGESVHLDELLFYAVALALHFLIVDHSLRQLHRRTYHRIGRWILASVIVLGWGIGEIVAVSDMAIGALEAFLGGGIVMNVLKEELPEERESRFGPFLGGAAVYSVLLLVA